MSAIFTVGYVALRPRAELRAAARRARADRAHPRRLFRHRHGGRDLRRRREAGAASPSALILSGLTVANIIGVPIGTAIGNAFGWRMTFWAVAALGVVAFGADRRCSCPPIRRTSDAARQPPRRAQGAGPRAGLHLARHHHRPDHRPVRALHLHLAAAHRRLGHRARRRALAAAAVRRRLDHRRAARRPPRRLEADGVAHRHPRAAGRDLSADGAVRAAALDHGRAGAALGRLGLRLRRARSQTRILGNTRDAPLLAASLIPSAFNVAIALRRLARRHADRPRLQLCGPALGRRHRCQPARSSSPLVAWSLERRATTSKGG